jgi:hypothetical protein
VQTRNRLVSSNDTEHDGRDDDTKRADLADKWNVDLHNRGINHMRWLATKNAGLKLIAPERNTRGG